jgi:type I restriction enzyme S subunit
MEINLKPYPAYKDSGVPWLGKVPAHWETKRAKNIFRCIDVRSETGEEELLTVSSERGVIPRRSANVTMFKAESYIGYKLCWPDDLVINSLWAWARGLGVSPYYGIVSSAYGVYRLRNKRTDNPRFIHELLRSAPFQWELQVRSKGIWVSRLQITDDAFLDAPLPVPPSNEQKAIVRFLNYMDRRIRRYSRAKQRLIKLLEEYKQAIIHQALTGQIDVRTGKPYTAYKDSGVEWLGRVPEHWEVRRLKRIARLNPSKSEVPIELRNDQAVFLPMECVGSNGQFDASELRLVSDLWNGFTYFRRGDVIIAKITPCFENGKGACLENLPTAIGFGSTEFHVIRPSKAIIAAYLYRVTTLSEFRRLGADEMTGATGQQRVPVEFIANFPIPLPSLPEQTVVVAYLDAKTAQIENTISAIRREIELLREYRERIIADVITGKVDVLEIAAQLPEEPEEDIETTMDEEEAKGETDQGKITESDMECTADEA